MDLHRFSAFDYMKLVVGSALVAAAFQFFTFPNSIVSGGVTGIAQIIRLLTGIPVGVLSILINIPIFCLGWRTSRCSAQFTAACSTVRATA